MRIWLKRTMAVLLFASVVLAMWGAGTREAAAAGPCGDVVVVTLGDTLTGIADRCMTTVDAILDANPEIQNRNLIYVGQRLDMPDAEAPEMTRYVVQAGDTLTRIAARFDTTVEAILEANLEIADRNTIDAGQELMVPGEDTMERVSISPMTGNPGTTVRIFASGFPANTAVQVGAGVINTEFVVVEEAQTNEAGTLSMDLTIPSIAEPGEEWVVVVRVVGTEIKATSDVFTVTTSTEEPGWERVNIYLVAPDDGGSSGKLIGCNDSLVPVEVVIEPTVAPLGAALEALLAAEGPMYGQSGLYNALHRSDLALVDVQIVGGEARIWLSGDLVLGGECDIPRVSAQIEGTALQFATVNVVQVWLNDQPLAEALSVVR